MFNCFIKETLNFHQLSTIVIIFSLELNTAVVHVIIILYEDRKDQGLTKFHHHCLTDFLIITYTLHNYTLNNRMTPIHNVNFKMCLFLFNNKVTF